MLRRSYVTTLAATGLLAALAVLVMQPGQSQAAGATLTVTTTADGIGASGCSLREAIKAARDNIANDCGGPGSLTDPDTIILPDGTYTLSDSATGDEHLMGVLVEADRSGTATAVTQLIIPA